jgi:hypothetical protein
VIIGYLPVIPGGGNLFFQPVNARYERSAMILGRKSEHVQPVTKRHISPPLDIKSRGFWHQPVTWLL